MRNVLNLTRSPGARLAGAALPLLLLLGACDDYPTEPPAGVGVALPDSAEAAPEVLSIGIASHGNIVRPKGYLYVNSPYGSGPISNSRTFNDGGGAVRKVRIGPGLYDVTFDGLGSVLNGQAHVQVKPATNGWTNHRICSASTPSTTNNVTFVVHCTSDDGFHDMPFEVQIFDHDAQAAFASIASNGSANNYRTFSRSLREVTGRYYVFFKKDPYFNSGAKPAAFVTTSAGNTNCQLYAIDTRQQQPDEYGVLVDCYDRHGHRRDTGFNVLVAGNAYKGGHALFGDNGKQVWSGYSYNWTGEDISVVWNGLGRYTVRFQGLGGHWSDDGTAMITAHGASNESCAVFGPTKQNGDVVVNVTCDRPGGGGFADSRYTLAVMSK